METNELYIPPAYEFDLPDEAMHLVTVGLAVLVDEPDKPITVRTKRAKREGADEAK